MNRRHLIDIINSCKIYEQILEDQLDFGLIFENLIPIFGAEESFKDILGANPLQRIIKNYSNPSAESPLLAGMDVVSACSEPKRDIGS